MLTFEFCTSSGEDLSVEIRLEPDYLNDEFFFHYTKTGGLYKSKREELSTQTLLEDGGKSSN